MKSLIVFAFFIGMFMIINGVYEQKFKALQENKRVEYRFVPRTYYEEQLSDTNLSYKMSDMFNHVAPWFDRNIGSGLDSLKTDAHK